MRILHVTPYYAPAWAYGGVVSAVTGLATAQAKLGHSVTVLTTDALDLDPPRRNAISRETIAGVTVIRCRNLSNIIRARYNLSLPRSFGSALASVLPVVDVIHTHELRTVENLLLGTPGCPVVLSPHGTLPYGTGRSLFKRAWDRLFGQRLLPMIRHVAALTQSEADEARTLWQFLNVPFPGATVIPNGVPADLAESVGESDNIRERYNLGDGPVVLFLGRLHERKGLQFLIPAFAQATQDIRDARLLVVGPDAGMLVTAQTLAAQLGIADRVTFTGMLTGDDQRAALATCDLFVLPAVGEGLSMAALEAMAARLPLILTPGCNLPDLETRGAGLLVDRDVEALAEALRTLLNDSARRRTMGENGLAWVREAFTWPAIAAQTEALYRSRLYE
jgi:glycosyltransferase involved in cell wall biosynthesis